MNHLSVNEFDMTPIEAVHSECLIEKVKASQLNEENETTYNINSNDNYENKNTFLAAKVAVDACLTGVKHCLET